MTEHFDKLSAASKRPLKVFLCHAHADRDAVRDLYTRLTNDGVDAWLDKEKLLPGQDWELEIRKAVREADVVVVCLSKQFNQAGFRQKEVRLALDTAMEKPEGEIFIIPAKLEQCENLESLKRWHEVNLFENDGYEMLMRALRAQAEKIGVTLQKDTDTDAEVSRIVYPSVVFGNRLSDAFPGLRGMEKIEGKEAVERLQILLEPSHVGLADSIWWLRGDSNMYISNFEKLDDTHVLLDVNQLFVDFIVAVRKFSDRKNFVYLQARAEQPTGLYKYEDGWIQNYLDKRLEENSGYFFYEEYGEWNGRLITRAEYDDGAAMINGKPTRTSGASLRVRYLTAYNVVICGRDHVLNNSEIDFDFMRLLDEILLGQKTVDDLVEFVFKLPKQVR